MTRLPFAAVPILLANVILLASGCGPVSHSRKPVSRAWLAELPPENRADLLRPVTPITWPGADPSRNEPAPLEVTLATGRPGNLNIAGDGSGDLPVELLITVRHRAESSASLVDAEYAVRDFYGRRVAGGKLTQMAVDSTGPTSRHITLDGLTQPGYYEVGVTLTSAHGIQRARGGFAILPATNDNMQPLDYLLCPADAAVAPAGRRIGCNLAYARNLIAGGAGVINLAARSAERQWHPQFDSTPMEALTAPLRKSGFQIVGHLGHGLATADATRTLPADPREFVRYTAPLVSMLDSVRSWDILPAPLEDPGVSSRELNDHLLRLRRTLNECSIPPDLWLSGHMAIINDYFASAETASSIDVFRFLDVASREDAFRAAEFTRRIPGARWVARLGETDPAASPQRRAWQTMKQALAILAAGGHVELPASAVLDPAQAAAMATVVRRAASGRYHGEVWPELHRVRSHVFNTPTGRAAFLWSEATEDGTATGPRSRGVIEIPGAKGIEARDCMGTRIGIWRERALVVPLGEAPVCILSKSLSAGDLVNRLRRGHRVNIAPVAEPGFVRDAGR
jgi:hypothetical protein